MQHSNKQIVCIILGGGGHAQVVIDCLLAGKVAVPYGILDSNSSSWGKKIMDVTILGSDDLLPELRKKGVSHYIVGVGGVRDNEPRRKIFERALVSDLLPLTVIHPSAICSALAKIGEGSLICPSAVINAGAILGINVIINTAAVIEHDCFIDNHSHIATGAVLSGGVHIGKGAHIGSGSVIKQNVHIGERAVIGSGSVVVNDIPSEAVVKGVPAR